MSDNKNREKVDMIASGYEWTCPDCKTVYKEIEIYSEVWCQKCDKHFEVEEAYHAYH